MDNVYFDQRWCAPHGIGRFASELHRKLIGYKDIDLAGRPSRPLDGIKLGRFLNHQRARFYFSPGYNVPIGHRCEVVCTIHDLIHLKCATENSLAKSIYYRFVQKPVVRRAPVTLTVSEYSRQEIVEWYNLNPEKVVVVGNGVSEQFQPHGDTVRKDVPYFLFVGACRSHKNVETLARAMDQLRRRHDVRLVFVSNDRSAIEKKCHGLIDDKAYEIVSGADDLKLASYYRGAVALVLPSYFEGFGLPLVEAMASGCPVIASNRTSIPGVVGDAAVLFDPDNMDELAKAMENVLGDNQLQQTMVQHGLERAKAFTWERVLERINSAIAPILAT